MCAPPATGTPMNRTKFRAFVYAAKPEAPSGCRDHVACSCSHLQSRSVGASKERQSRHRPLEKGRFSPSFTLDQTQKLTANSGLQHMRLYAGRISLEILDQLALENCRTNAATDQAAEQLEQGCEGSRAGYERLSNVGLDDDARLLEDKLYNRA